MYLKNNIIIIVLQIHTEMAPRTVQEHQSFDVFQKKCVRS